MKEKSSKSKRGNVKDIDEIINVVNTQERTIFKKPQICLIDFDEQIKENLEKKGFNIEPGTLGRAIEVPNENTFHLKSHKCLANFFFPPNLHEYDIIVLDLEYKEAIPYNIEHYTKKYVQGFSDSYFYSEYPEILFDPRPYGSYVLESEIHKNNSHPIILIVFANAHEKRKYQFVKETNSGTEFDGTQTCFNYSFSSKIPLSENKYGTEFIVEKESASLGLYNVLSKHILEATYHIVFNSPNVDKHNDIFIPLIKNSHNEIVSFLRISNNCILFIFPQIVEKNSFLDELLTDQLPTLWPKIFPFHSEFKWLKEEAYMLPNEENLLEQRKTLIKKFEEEIENKNREIKSNHLKYECLHGILTESGDQLVACVKTFLEWLGFEYVKVMDEELDGKLEEDLQVETEEGLLVIEVKGIGGTSKDEECSQIEKIKNRRMKEKKRFDIFGLYIVNHQRYQPPLIRENPPFKQLQIEDAKNEERGLLTTWQLFNLYYSIKNGCVSKEEARKAFYKYGLIEFSPCFILK